MASGWQRYTEYLYTDETLGVSLDVSRMAFPDDFFARMAPQMAQALREMGELERGAIANPDERRQVGHYWLRAPELAPTTELQTEIEQTERGIRAFARESKFGAPSRGPGDRTIAASLRRN